MNEKKKTSDVKKLPQNSRNITAKRKTELSRFFLFMVITGLGFIIFINFWSLFTQPVYITKLLQNPNDIETLAVVLRQTNHPDLSNFLRQYLRTLGQDKLINQTEKAKIKDKQMIDKINNLLQESPEYPDGYAYLAMLYWQNRRCDEAIQAIEQALKLDSKRTDFMEINEFIKECE